MKGFSSKQGKPFVHYRIMIRKDIKQKNEDSSRSKKIELT